MKKVFSLAVSVVLAVALGGCAQHSSQPMPHHSASQTGHSSKLGKLGN